MTINFVLFCMVLSFWISHAVEIKDLNGSWKLKNSTMANGIPARVPGGVHTALMHNGIIGDPLYRMNDKLYLWVGRTDWTYYTIFDVQEAFLQKQEILLVCEGLDTVSVVSINDIEVGRSVNMFVRYIFDVKHVLKVGENTIRVDFTSAVKYGKQQSENLPYPVPPDCPPAVFQGECHGNKVRKMQCAFSWDWGPAFVTQGIWKGIYIEAFDSAVIRYVTAETTKDSSLTLLRQLKTKFTWDHHGIGEKIYSNGSDPSGLWLLKFEVFLSWSSKEYTGTLTYKLGGTGISGTKKITMSGIKKDETYPVDVPIPQDMAIDMWWPNGYGKQTLYPLEVTYQSSNTAETSSKEIRIGFRTVELIQDLVSNKESDGRTFYFRINGQPIFLKGSNWIPADNFLERVTRERLFSYLKSAADAHMNTLRIWGGGIYEFDEFYETADELGILIWQDFMFACALYPATDAFLQTVSEEIIHQVRRLKHHPSLLAYSGNNENDVGIKGWWPHANRDKRYNEDYKKLYIDVIYAILKEEDPGRPFMASSPSNGIKTEKDGGLSRESPSSTKYGDIHDYNYGRAFYQDHVYRTPRMSSEYGLQSYPSSETLSMVYEKEDMFYESTLNNHRQHHGNGNSELRNQINMYLKPPASTNKSQRFLDIIYCTQIDQAIGMRIETEHYRRWQSQINTRGEGNTMGALYWMLNDIWQAPTWSSLEYGGKWKMIHYYARRFFAPVLISPYKQDDTLYVYIVLDEIPSYEYRNITTNTLELRPIKTKQTIRSVEIENRQVYSSGECTNRKTCWNKYIWYILTVCCVCLILNQFYHTLLKSRYWRKLWKYTLICLMLLLVMATLHMISPQEHHRLAATSGIKTEKEPKAFDLTGNLNIQVHLWNSLPAKLSVQVPFEMKIVSQLIYEETISKLLKKAKCSGPEDCFLTFHVDGHSESITTWYPLTNFKEARGLKKPNLQIASVTESTISREYTIVLNTDFPAPFVWLDAYGVKGRFSDNGFLMYKLDVTIKFYAWVEIDLKTFKKSLSVKSLMDIYNT